MCNGRPRNPDIAAVVAARGATYRFELLEAVRRDAGGLPEAVDRWT